MSNTAWSVILIVVLAGMTLFAWRFNRARFLVIVCHNVVWAGALSLVSVNLIAYKQSTWMAWATLAAGLVFFNLGVWLARTPVRSWFRPRTGRSGGDDEAQFDRRRDNALLTRRSLLVLVLVYLLAFGYYIMNIAVRFGLDVYVTHPSAIRSFKGASYLESVPFPIRVFLYLGPLLFVAFGYKAAVDRPLPLWLRVLALVLLAGTMLALLQRTNLFMGVLWLVSVLLTGSHRSKVNPVTSPAAEEEPRKRLSRLRSPKARILLGVLGFGLVAFVAFQTVGGALGENGQQALSSGAVSAPLESSGLTSPYVYYTAGTIAFLQLVDSDNHEWPPPRVQGTMTLGDYNPQTWGASTFAPILKAIPGARPFAAVAPFIDTAVLTNVYTWLEPYYRDFRLPGVAIAMALLGLLIGRLYVKRFESTAVFWIQSAFLSTIFLATFVTKINNTLFLSEVVFVLVITVLSASRRRRPRIMGGLAATRAEAIPSGPMPGRIDD